MQQQKLELRRERGPDKTASITAHAELSMRFLTTAPGDVPAFKSIWVLLSNPLGTACWVSGHITKGKQACHRLQALPPRRKTTTWCLKCAEGTMSSGSFNSVNKEEEEDDDEYARSHGGYRQFPPSYNDSQAASQRHQHESMSPQPSVGRFTEKEKTTTMFSRKPPTPKNYEGVQAVASQSYHGLHHSQDSSSSQSTGAGIVNLRVPPRGEDKMNKRKK